jgi:DNA (cytosine-5)-methyltransferase 1
LAGQGYSFGALEIDAADFLPQSRPRVFVIATREPPARPDGRQPLPSRAVRAAHAALPPDAAASWVWWAPRPSAGAQTRPGRPAGAGRRRRLHSPPQTARLLDLMGPLHRARLAAVSGRAVGAVFRRTRVEDGMTVQRAEVRFDGLAGCLRTPRGGSSRQSIVVVEDGAARSRLMTPREAARLMGLPDSYACRRPPPPPCT